MKEERKKISFREELTISKFRLWGGLIVSTLLSLSLYLFFVTCRDFTRLLTFTSNYNFLELNSNELFFYNLFYAILSLLVGQSYFLKIVFDKNKSIYEKSIQFKRKKVVHDQNILIWFFLLWFIRTAGLTAFLYMNFNTVYPIDFYYDLNFYSDYKHLFFLILLVLFLQSWQGFGIAYRKPLKQIIISALIIVCFSLLFTQIKIINFENHFQNEKSKNIYRKERIQLPKIDNFEYFDNFDIKGQVFINEKFEFVFNKEKINEETLIKNLIKLENTPYYDIGISMLRLNIDKNLPIDSLYKLKSKIYFNTSFDFFYATCSQSTKYGENYFQDKHFGIKDSLILNLLEINSNENSISKFSNIISLKQKNNNEIAYNSVILNYDEIVTKIKNSILLDNNYIIKIQLKENATFSDYISILSLAKKGFSKANMQILKESKNNDEYYKFRKGNLNFRFLDINQSHPGKELYKLPKFPINIDKCK